MFPLKPGNSGSGDPGPWTALVVALLLGIGCSPESLERFEEPAAYILAETEVREANDFVEVAQVSLNGGSAERRRRDREPESVLARRPAQARRVLEVAGQPQLDELFADDDFLGPIEHARFDRRRVESDYVEPLAVARRERDHRIIELPGGPLVIESAPIRAIEEVPRRALQQAIFGVVINGREVGEAIVVVDGKDILVPLEVLQRGGLVAQIPTERDIDGVELVSLQRLKESVRFRIDEDSLMLVIDLGAELFDPSYISLATRKPLGIIYTDDLSAFFNYSVRGNTRGGLGFGSELGIHFGDGLLLVNADINPNRGFVRGLSQLIFDDTDSLHRWTVGDAFIATGALGGGPFLAGLTLEKTYALDPYLARTPSLSFANAVTTPSTLEIWVDGVFVRRVELEPGAFRVADLPAPTLAGDATYIVRDAMGRTQTFSQPYHMSGGLLAPGLHEYAFSAGVTRHGVGLESFDYETPVVLARHRAGVSQDITAGWHAEAAPTDELVNGGVRATVALPIGRVEVGAAASHRKGRSGAAVSGSWDFATRGFGIATYAVARTPDYAVVGSDPSEGGAALEWGGRLSVSDRLWRFGVDGRFQRERDGTEVTRGSASLSVTPTPGVDIGVRGGVSQRRGEALEWQALATVNLSPGAFTATASQRVDNDGTETSLQVNVPIREEYGLGTQAVATFGETVNLRATQEARTQYGRVRADLSYDAAGFAFGAELAGGLAFVSGAGLHLTRPVTGGFAIIEVPDGVDTRVFRDNREVGRTVGGSLMVPDLLANYGNRLSLGVNELPLEFEIGESEQVIAPPYRGGARVVFSVIRTVYVRGFIERDGHPVAYGTLVMRLGDEVRRSPLGGLGEFELQGVRAGLWSGEVEHRDGRCEVEVDIPASHAPVVTLGVFVCRGVGREIEHDEMAPRPIARRAAEGGR